MFGIGAKIGYYGGDPKLLLEDMQKLRWVVTDKYYENTTKLSARLSESQITK